MIGGLQGEIGDLDNKYLKQNIPKYLKMSVGNIRKLQENTAALYIERKTLQVSAIRRSGHVYPEKLKRPPLPSGCEISGCKMLAHGSHPDVKMLAHEIPDMKCPVPPGYPDQLHPDSPKRTCVHAIRSNFIRIPSKGHVACSPIRTREHHTRTIAYPIRMCCPDH